MKFIDKGTSLVSKEEIEKLGSKLLPEIEQMNKATKLWYDDERSSINLIHDKSIIKDVKALAKQFKNISMIIVVGIGGSNLGTIAVAEAVYGKMHNLYSTPKILFADTVDSDYMTELVLIAEAELKKGKNIVVNIVSKSGGTTETVANFEIFAALLKKYKKNSYKKYVVATTDYGSKLWDIAGQKGFARLGIPKLVGGRYSVFSAVGLFPLAVIGVDIDKLLKGAQDIRRSCLQKKISTNPAALLAIIEYLHYKKLENISNLFLFSPSLESVGKWYRQLMGESIGKEKDKMQRIVNVGMTPTFAVGSTDLHSMSQLYLGGPYDKFTTFITVDKEKTDLKLPSLPDYEKLVSNIQGRPLAEIMSAILQGVKTAYKKSRRPFVEISLPSKDEYDIGRLLQFFMMQMMYLGYLLDVNPFNQPSVEKYKEETRKILNKRR